MSVSSQSVLTVAKVKVAIEGLPPGVMFQGKGLMEVETTKGKHLPPEKEAELRAHWMGRGKKRQLCIPAVMFYKCFCQAAMDFKQPENRKKNMSYLIAPTLSFEEPKIPLGTDKFEVYEDWVHIPPKTGGCVKIGRPLLPKWKVGFTMLVDDEMWDAPMLEEIIIHAGKIVGIGAWRPALKGPYGRFLLRSFEVLRGA